ncbi:hypothetical protein DMP08_11265 [Paraeggerthella hongkongensis]|uniref:Uncharacterized protein n=1 Tax=Paraeggerthella hongkongensis TaxID=230658 RepID=A0A3N0AW45_9ACTN|nr:hypothetical protein DMP08_11265 [Paraeggerthella hongkongensis]
MTGVMVCRPFARELGGVGVEVDFGHAAFLRRRGRVKGALERLAECATRFVQHDGKVALAERVASASVPIQQYIERIL